jgi:hypothetical protein
MKPIVPPIKSEGGTLVTIAENQPEYSPLPAYIDKNGLVMTEWVFSDEEIRTIIEGGKLRMWISTFNSPLQPVSLEIVRPPST